MRILVVGAGATGGYVGARLVQAGRDVTFLLRAGRAEQIRAQGLAIVSPLGDAVVHPRMVSAEQLRSSGEIFDLIVISTKAYQLAEAMEDFAPAVGPRTMLLPILNGMRQLEILDARFGAEQVLGGSVRIVADTDAEGRIHQASTLSELSFGERSRKDTARIHAVEEALSVPGIDAKLQPDILATLWQKWWILSSLGSICILSRGAVGEAAEVPGGKEFAYAVIGECTAIAERNGYPARPAMLADHHQRMTLKGSTLTSSLYRDMTRGYPVEADHILGDLLDRAQGISAPLVTAAYVQLKVYERTRSA